MCSMLLYCYFLLHLCMYRLRLSYLTRLVRSLWVDQRYPRSFCTCLRLCVLLNCSSPLWVWRRATVSTRWVRQYLTMSRRQVLHCTVWIVSTCTVYVHVHEIDVDLVKFMASFFNDYIEYMYSI